MRWGNLMALAGLMLMAGCAHRDRGAFEFALIGDVPYTEQARTNSFPNMVREINKADVAFVVHDGDIKSGPRRARMNRLGKRWSSFKRSSIPCFIFSGTTN